MHNQNVIFKVIKNLKSKKKKYNAYVFYNSMDSFHYKTYVHILFSEENSLIYSYLEEVYFISNASFQEAIPPTYFPYAK